MTAEIPPEAIPEEELTLAELEELGERLPLVNADRIKMLAALITDGSELVTALGSERITPDTSTHTFQYLVAESASIAVPEIVHEMTKDIPLFAMTLSLSAEKGSPSCLSIEFVREDGVIVYVSRLGSEQSEFVPDSIISKTGKAIDMSISDKISQIELNRFITSLIQSDMTIDFSKADSADYLNPEFNDSLVLMLERAANFTSDTGAYVMADKSTLRYTQKEGELTSFDLTFETAQPGRHIVVQIDCDAGAGINFFADENNERIRIKPDLGVIIHLREIMQQAYKECRPVRADYLDNANRVSSEGLDTDCFGRNEPDDRLA